MSERNKIVILGAGLSGSIAKILLSSARRTLRLYEFTGLPAFPDEVVRKLKKLSEYDVFLVGTRDQLPLSMRYLPVYFSFRKETPLWYKDYWKITLSRLTNISEKKIRFGVIYNRTVIDRIDENLSRLYADKIGSNDLSLRLSAGLDSEFYALSPDPYYIHSVFTQVDHEGTLTKFYPNSSLKVRGTIDLSRDDLVYLTFFNQSVFKESPAASFECDDNTLLTLREAQERVRESAKPIYVYSFNDVYSMESGKEIYDLVNDAGLDYAYILDPDLPYFRVTVLNDNSDKLKCTAEYMTEREETRGSVLKAVIPQGKVMSSVGLRKLTDSNTFFIGRGGKKDKSRTTDLLFQLLETIEL